MKENCDLTKLPVAKLHTCPCLFLFMESSNVTSAYIFGKFVTISKRGNLVMGEMNSVSKSIRHAILLLNQVNFVLKPWY